MPEAVLEAVLVVDDYAPIRALVRDVLEAAGYAVREAADGAAALALVRRAPPSVVLLDVGLPVLDGPGFLAAYRRGPGPHAPLSAVPWGPVLDLGAERVRAEAQPGLTVAQAALAALGTGAAGALDRLEATARRVEPAAGPVVLPLVEGLRRFAGGEYAAAADRLAPLADRWVTLGGSNEQRALFEDTLLEAQLRAGRAALAEAALRRRLAKRPSARDRFWLGRAQAGQGRPAAAAASLRAARAAWSEAEAGNHELAALDTLLRTCTA
jgi:CheY-like chemotaxis protein